MKNKKELEIKFKSGEEMLQMLQKGIDLYNPKTRAYVFMYSDEGAIAFSCITNQKALRYARKEQQDKTAWSENAGKSCICDVPQKTSKGKMSNLDFCKDQYDGLWLKTSDFLQWYGPYMVAYDIEWETDGTDVELPKEMQISADQISIGDGFESVSNYLSDITDYLTSWFRVGLCLRGEIMELVINSYDDNIRFAFEKGNLLSGGHVISFNKREEKWEKYVIWYDHVQKFSELSDPDSYVTEEEIEVIEHLCDTIIRAEKEHEEDLLEIAQILTISSKHLARETKELLDDSVDDMEESPMPPVYEKQGFGWFIACDPSSDAETPWESIYPKDLVRVMKFAKEKGCFWLCIDVEGPLVKSLPIYVENESPSELDRFTSGLAVKREGDDESDGILCPFCGYEVARNDDYRDMRPKHCPECETKLIY